MKLNWHPAKLGRDRLKFPNIDRYVKLATCSTSCNIFQRDLGTKYLFRYGGVKNSLILQGLAEMLIYSCKLGNGSLALSSESLYLLHPCSRALFDDFALP